MQTTQYHLTNLSWRKFGSLWHSIGVDKLRPADQFDAAHQISCTSFSSTTFLNVESIG